MSSQSERAVLAVDFAMPDGSRLKREWKMGEVMPEWTKSPPSWLDAANRSWPNPQGPIILSGLVREGCEADARHQVLGESDFKLVD